jgi:hypothetical protein
MDRTCSKDWTEVHTNFWLENQKQNVITSKTGVDRNMHITRQAMYCTYNVTLRRVSATIVVVEK